MSKEHIIADWIRNLIAEQGGDNIATWFNESPMEDGPFLEMIRKTRKRAIGAETIREVCKDCNNGWMAKTQQRAKPILAPLIRGSWEEFDREHCDTLSQWATMTAINIDASTSRKMAISQDQREHFMLRSCIPQCAIFVGICANSTIEIYQRSMEMGFLTTDGSSQQFVVVVTTFQIGNVVFQVCILPKECLKFDPWAYGSARGFRPIDPPWFIGGMSVEQMPVLFRDNIHEAWDKLCDTLRSEVAKSKTDHWN